MWVVEDPLVTLEVLAPYVVTTHVRDSVVYEHPRGAAAQWVALGDGCIDFHKFMDRYRELCPKASHAARDHHRPPAAGAAVPGAGFLEGFSESERVRVRPVRGAGPRTAIHSPASWWWKTATTEHAPEFTAALREQQRVDLERSLEYAKKSLGVGVRWRS